MSEEKITLADLLANYELEFDELRYTLRTKLDKDTHDELIEWSNRLTNGSISGVMRICIALGLEKLEEEKKDVAPSLAGVVKGRRKWMQKHEATARLIRGAMELKQRYDSNYEAELKEYAKAEGLQWPPGGRQAQADPVLRRVVERLKVVLAEKESASLRDIYRNVSSMDAEGARIAVFQLEEMGAVQIAGSREDNSRMKIRWSSVPLGD